MLYICMYIYRTIYAYMQIYLLRVVFGLFKNLKILKYFPFAFAACNQKYLKLYIVYVYIYIYWIYNYVLLLLDTRYAIYSFWSSSR